ncbi:MAG: hypothetical protein E3J72_07865 [Planctomycetota bacterium]|nr:MAG: hypothetical protein E3J72_07865 [Planctomycetota bacterium]
MIFLQELLFGQIAIAEKIVDEEQLAAALDKQHNEARNKSIGLILVELGFANPEQIEKILEVQAENLKKASSYNPRKKSGETFFGTIAVMKRFTTLSKVVECLREQERLEKFNIFLRLGEIFVSRGYLSSEQVKKILSAQQSVKVRCDGCRRMATIEEFNPSGRYTCPACGDRLTPEP